MNRQNKSRKGVARVEKKALKGRDHLGTQLTFKLFYSELSGHYEVARHVLAFPYQNMAMSGANEKLWW